MAKKKFTDLMVDIETVSTKKNAKILSIGYCLFNIKTGEIGPKADIFVECTHPSYHTCPRTLKWWESQPKEAQALVFANHNTVPIKDGLQKLTDVLVNETTGTQRNGCRVWGNGPTFDLTILSNAYEVEGLSGQPWSYGNERDVRTIVDLGRELMGFDPKKDMPFEGVKHAASDDSAHQAKYVSAIYRKLKAEVLKCKI